jgi:hemerythrin-like domain-containing protein
MPFGLERGLHPEIGEVFVMARRRKMSSGTLWGLIGGGIAAGAALIPFVPAIRRRAMNVTTILKKDHRMVSGLILSLEMTPRMNGRARKALFEQIRYNLTVHADAEQEVVYPAMKMLSFGQEQEKVDESYREHQTLKDLLGQMERMDAAADEFDGKLKELKDNIQRHVTKEEYAMFPIMTERMSHEQLRDLGRRLHDRKKEIKTRMAA